VQWYVRDLVTSVTWADKELKGFEKVTLSPGESVDVTLDLPVSDCTIVDADGVRVVEQGDFEVLVGPDSRDASLLDARFAVVA
jgi:beta-glucosidase